MSDTQVLFDPPTALLKAVHDRMKELFDRYAALGPGSSWSKKGLFHVIRDILLAHMEIEEALFYPAIQAMSSDLAINSVMRALRDHEHLKALLEELAVLGAEEESLDAKVGDLERILFSHLQLEESEIFPHARMMPPELLRKLSIEMEKLREGLRKSR